MDKLIRVSVLAAVMAAAGAAAFTPTDVVIVDGAPLYEEGRCGDEAGVIAELPFWTAVAAETVGNPESPRTYGHATLKGGETGELEWADLGKLFVAVRDDAPVRATPEEEAAVVAWLAQGDWVGEVRIVHAEVEGRWLEVVTGGGARGWLDASLAQPYPTENKTHD